MTVCLLPLALLAPVTLAALAQVSGVAVARCMEMAVSAARHSTSKPAVARAAALEATPGADAAAMRQQVAAAQAVEVVVD